MTPPAALVLTAGLGTRLRPLTYLRAKGAVPVNGEPLAHRVARWLAAHGIREQIFNLHHLPATITAALGDGSDSGARIRYSWEPEVLGSAGGPRHALPLLTDGTHGTFLIVNGDTLTDVDVAALLRRHGRSGALVTMALIPNPAPDKYGGVVVDEDGYVMRFSRPGEACESYHFVGVQAAEPAVVSGLDDNVRYESVNWLYPKLIRENPRSIAAFVSDARFLDIGAADDYLQTCLDLASKEGNHLVSAHANIGPATVVDRCVVWDDVEIGAGAKLVECVIGDGARVPDGACYRRSALVPSSAGNADAAMGERIEGDLLIKTF